MTANTTASVRAFAGRRWLCLISAMVICVCAGFGYAWSVLQTPIIAQFGWADSGVALAYTITVVCSTMAPLLFGGLIRRMSSRLCVAVGAVLFGAGLFAAGLMSQLWQLYLFYGVISGMASGLGTAAYGSGAILWAPTAAVLMEKVGLGSAFRVLGVLFAAVILLGSLLLAEPPEGFHAAMAPAAYDTIQAHFRDTGRRPSDYDLIVTGDLGSLGKEILLDLFHRDGIEFKNLEDCGVLIYDAQTQDVHCGGSGCGCSAAVLTGFLLNGMKQGRWRRLLFCGTGALLSPTSTLQGESIPSICHAVAISTEQ